MALICCPKCGYQRLQSDSHVHHGICPACGIAYAKWNSTAEKEIRPYDETADTSAYEHVVESRRQQIIDFFMHVPCPKDTTFIWGKVLLACLFALWGAYFIFNGVDWEVIGGSFLHNVNLPFHEFGHVLFSPFGRFMSILGGSLFQVIMPLIALFSFSIQMRDNFAASIMLWWAGQSMIDVAPYIADAKHRALPLIMGLGEESHDWGNLLTMMNCVDSAKFIANTVFIIGSITILAALIWSFKLLRRQYHLQKEGGAAR